MDALQFLKEEHEKAKQMLGQILGASAEQRGQLWKKLKPELKVHEQIEEAALYGPVARDAGNKELAQWETHHREEVAELESLIQELDEVDPSEEAWADTLEDVHERLEHRIDEEEEEDVWPKIRQAWDRSKLDEAAKQMEMLKKQAMKQAA